MSVNSPDLFPFLLSIAVSHLSSRLNFVCVVRLMLSCVVVDAIRYDERYVKSSHERQHGPLHTNLYHQWILSRILHYAVHIMYNALFRHFEISRISACLCILVVHLVTVNTYGIEHSQRVDQLDDHGLLSLRYVRMQMLMYCSDAEKESHT